MFRCAAVVALAAGVARGLPVAASDPASLTVTRPENSVLRVADGERPVLLFKFQNARRTYIKELYTPAGVQLLLDGPADHPHHHGVMFGVTMDGVDFWAEGDGCGSQVHTSRAGMEVLEEHGVSIWQPLDWSGHGRLARESRLVKVHEGVGAVTLVSWRSDLQVRGRGEEQGARITGSHYCGLGMRFVREMDKNGLFINSQQAPGEVVRGDEKLYPGRWCAYQSEVDGKPVTVAMFDDPENVRPATWFTMADPFAYLSATMRLHEEPLIVERHKSLRLRYGIAAWDGHASRETIESTYMLWLQLEPRGQATQPAIVPEKPTDQVKP